MAASDSDFTWRDGERTIHFRAGAVSETPAILRDIGLDHYELLTTERAMGAAPVELARGASCFHHIPPGPVNEVAARVIGDVGDVERPNLVALGGGRVIDTAKAIAAVRGGRVIALPTTLSGAEMTRIHRLPEREQARDGLVRPALVVADPPLMVTLAEPNLRASALNALAHGADCLYTALVNPVSEMAALRGAKLIAKALDTERSRRDPATLALGSMLCAYALDSAGFALHHVVCQTLVRVMRIPHAETNAAMLPRVIEALIGRAGKQMTALARSLGVKQADLAERIVELGGGPIRLSTLGAARSDLGKAVKAMLERPELRMTPDVPGESELRRLVESAW